MSDTSNSNNDVNINVNMEGNAAQQAAELSAQIVNLSQHLATLSQRAVQNANVTKAFNQSMGLSASGVSQYSREITQSLNPLSRMTRAVEIQKRVLDQATRSAEAYSAAQKMLNQSSADPMALNRSNAAMSQSVKHMNAMRLSSNDLQKAMKQVALLDYSRRMSENAMKSQQSAYNFFRNFSLPLITGLREAFFSYSKLATESNRTTKLILDNFNQIGAAGNFEDQTKAARAFTASLGKDLDKITRDWGTSRVLIQSLAGDFAELGISSRIVLGDLTRMTAETEKLGNLDISQSSEFIQTMYQTILRIRRETGKSVDINSDQVANEIISQLRGQLAVFNTIENKTVMSLRNIADAFPEVTAAATSFGLSMTEAMSLVIPMIGAGFQVGASANSVKVSLQRMVAMTKQNTEIINQLNAEMGTGFKYSAGVGMENIQMLTDAYRTLSKSVSEGGKGKQGALEFFSRLFGVRQGPRMETAFAQLAAFQTSLETYGSVERTTADILQNSINVELAAIGSKKIAIKQFLDLSNIHRMAIEKDSGDVLTAQAKAIQKGQKTAQKLLESANSKNSDFISGMSTEVGKALMAQAFDVNSLAGKQFEAELKLSQDTPEVRYRRAKESLMALGRAVVPVVDVFLKGLLPVLEKLASFLQNNPFVAKLVSALLGLVALSGPLRMIFTTMQTAFGGAVGLFVKLSRVISGTTLQFASLQDLIMNPNLLRGQQRVVQYLDGFLIKSKRGAKELKEAYDFSGISLPAKEAIQAGGIYGSDKAVNMKRVQPFVPQTNQFMNDLKTINAQSSAQMATKVADASESGVTKGTANLSNDLQKMFSTVMHRFQGPNLFAGPNYFEGNLPFGGTSGGPGSTRTPRAPRGSGGAIADDLTPEETIAAVAANEARKARLRPPTVTTYPKGTLFPSSTAKSFNDLEKALNSIKKRSGSLLFSPANAAAGAMQAASAVARPQAPFNPAQLLSNISQNRIALGRDPLGPVAIQRFLSRAGDNVKLSFDQIREWYVQAGKPISDQLEYAFSKGGVFTVSKGTLDAVKTKIFDKTKQGVFTLATGEEGVDKRLKGLASIRGFRNMGKTVQAELVPVIASVSDSIAEQVNVGLNQSLATLNELRLDNMLRTPMGATGGVINDLTAGKPVLVDDIKRAIEDHFIAAESITNGVVRQSSTTVVNSLKDIDKLLPNIVNEIDVIANEAGPLSSYGDDLRKAFRNVRAKTHRFVESVSASGQRMVSLVKNEVLVPGNDAQLQIRAADEAAKKADVGAADAAAKKAAAEQAAKTRPDYVLNKRIEEARLKVQKLREAKVDALSRVGDYTPPLPTTEPVLVGRLGALDEAIKEQNDEIQKEIKRFKAAKDELNSVISQETDLETTKTGKSRIRAAGKRRMQELQEEHDWELNLLRKQQAKMIADRNRVLNSPAAIQRQIDDTLATLPKDVRAAVQDVDRAISDEMKQLSVRTESRIARMKRALAGIGRADKTTTRAAVPINSMLNAIPSQIKQMGSDGSPLDVFKYKGSRFFNDPRFQQPNARMFDARRGLSLPTSIKSFFGMDRVKPLFQFPKSLSAAFDYTQFTGSDIIMRFADSLEEQLLTVVSTSQTEVKHISEVMRRLASTKTKHKHLPNVLRNFLAATMNIPGMTQDQIESMINLSVNNVVNDVTKTFKGGTAGRDGLKSGTPASLKAFFERLRKKTQGLDGEKMGLQELLFGSSLIKLKEGENFGTSRGITGALQNVVYQSMSGGFVGLGGSFDEGVPKVKKRGINDWWRPLAARKNAAKNAPKGVGKKVVEELADTLNESVDDAIEMVDEIQNEIQEQLVAPVQKAVNNVKPKVNVYKPGELFPGRAPVIAQATAAAGASVTPTPLTLKGLKNTEIELPGTKRQAEKMMESAQRELARQLGIDAKASGASAKIKKLSVANFEKEIERLQGMIVGEQKVLDTLSTPAMRKGPERNLAKLNKQLKELAFARDKYLVAEFALANAAAEVVPTAPSTIAPTGATGATAPTAPPPRVPTSTTPVIPTPVTPSAIGGAGKVIDIKKFGQVFKGPNLFHGPNIFDSSLSDLIPNFDELLSPVEEAAEAMADAGDEVATSLSRVLAAGEAHKLTGNLVGPGEVGEVSRLSRTKARLFGMKGIGVPSVAAGLDAAQIAKTAGLVDALDAKKLRLKFDDAGALIGMSRIKKLGGEMAISFDRANSILAGRLLPNFTRLNKFFSSSIVKGWAFALTGGLSAAVKPAQSLLKALTATGEASMRGKARAAIDTLVASRGPDQKTGIVRKAMAGLSGATGGINSLAAAGSKAADVMFKIGSAIAMIGTVAVIALPIIVLMFGIFQAWKSAQGRLATTTEALKQSLTNLKDAVVALFAPIRDMVNGFLGASSVGSTFMTQGEKNAAMFYGIATAIKKATGFMKKWAETTGKAFMTNQVAPFLTRLINRFILLGSAIKSAFSGDKEAAGKKLKAFLYSLIYELLNFTKGVTEIIAMVLKGLIPVLVYVAQAGVIVFREMFKEMIRMARNSAFDIGVSIAKMMPSIGTPIKIFEAVSGGKESGEQFSSDFSSSITASLSGLVDPIKRGLNASLTKGMSEVGKKYAELMGQGINIPLAQRLKNPKAFQEALKYNAKQSADAATAAGESLGGNVNSGIKDKMKEIKETIKGYFYSNVDAKFENIIQQYIDALSKQKDQQLKAYDDQIAGIDALADAEERLTAKKEYETKRREMIDQRATDRENYLVERRLAVYEGRAFDVRKLDREEMLAQRNSGKEIQELDSGRLSQLQSEQRDLAKQAIANQKDLAEKQFQEVLDTFDRFIEDVKNKSFATQEEFAAALKNVGEQANISSAELAKVFANNIGELPGIIAGVRDPSIKMFSANMDDLIREASKKFGLDANVANPSTVLGAVRMMAIGSEEGFKAAFNPVFATTYVQPTVDAIAKIASSLSEKGNKNNIAEIWQKAGEDAFAKLKNELNRDIAFPKILDSFSKLLEDLKPLVKQIVSLAGEASGALGGIGDNIVPGAAFTQEDRAELEQFLLKFAPSDAGRRSDISLNSPSLQKVVGIIMRDYDKGNQYMLSNMGSYGLNGLERVILQGYLNNQMVSAGSPTLMRPLPGQTITKYNGGAIGHYGRGGFLEAPSSQGIPALLHGGEYIINHKAVEKFGKGNLARINALKNGGDLKGFASGGYMTTPGFANGGYMTTPGFGFGGFLDKLKFGLGGKGPGGPWGGLATGMRNAVVNAGSKAVRLVDSVLTGGALTDVSRSVVESAKGNNKEAAKLAATGVAKGTFQMLGGKLIGAAFKPLAKFGGAYFLEKAGLAGAGISASQAVRLGIGTATRNALEREAVAIAGSRVATGFGDNYLNTLVKEISGETTNYGTSQGLGDPATGLMGNVLRADNIAIRDAKAQANRLAFEAAQARGMTLNQAGGYPYPSGSFQSRGPITKIADLISNLNPFQQRIGIHVGRPGSTEILPNQIATGPSDTIKGLVYSWLKGSPEIIASDARGFAGSQGFLDPSLTRLGAESIDEAVRPGSYYITKAKGAILRDANIVNSPARASNWAQVLRELPITSTKEELEAALAQSRGNSGVKGVFNTIKNKTRALINSIKSPFTKKPVSTKGGALVPYNSSIKTYKAGTGVLSEVPGYVSPEGFKLQQLGLYVHKIGNEHVVFGGMSKPLSGLAKRNPGLNIKSIGLNPYEISGLKPGTAEGDALANQWIRARFGHAGMGNSVDDTYVSALLYDWKKNNNFFSMLKFKQYEMLGSAKVENLRIERKLDPEELLGRLMPDGKEKILPEHLFLTHETRYPIKIDKAGNALLHPMSAFDTTSGTVRKGPFSGGPFNMGMNAEHFRDTLHFALNHRVVGHGQRQNVEEGYFLIAEAMEAFKANPAALDNAYTVDTFLTPPPGQPLRFPKGSYKIVKLGKDAKEFPHTAMQEMISKLTGITKPVDEFGFTSFDEMNAYRDSINQYFLRGGDHGAGDPASQAVGTRLADMFGVFSARHFDQFSTTDMLHLKKGANQSINRYINPENYIKAGENHWSRLLARDPFVQNLTLPYDNPKLAEKIKKTIEQFTELGYSYPTGRRYNNRAYNGGYMPKFKKGGYLKFKEGGEVPSILHGGEYVLNSAAVKKYGLAHLEAMNQMKFNVPSAGFSVPQAAYSGSAAGGMTTSTQNVNIYVDNFIGEPEWFNSMMKDYNTKILPKNQKAAGLENRVISTYNGLNRGQ